MTQPSTAELAAWDHRYLWHPFTQMRDWLAEPPLVIERGEGNYLIDTEERRYLDGVSSLWCNVHGHRHARIDAAVREQLERVAHTTMLGLTHPAAACDVMALPRSTPAHGMHHALRVRSPPGGACCGPSRSRAPASCW